MRSGRSAGTCRQLPSRAASDSSTSSPRPGTKSSVGIRHRRPPMVEPRTVIVTGGSRGLGAGIVRSFLESGDRVATCSRSSTAEVEARAKDPETADRFLFVQADLARRDHAERFVKSVVEQWGGVDVLVNNAGVARDGVLALFSDEDVDTVVDLNL